MPAPNPSRLIVSIHDVSPRFEREVDILIERLANRLGGLNFAMLVVPDHWDSAPIARDVAFQRRLRSWADAGVEMFLHGWCHRAKGNRGSALTRWMGRTLTAGEGEFLELNHDEALFRMREGRKVLEDAIGQDVAGFIAPAWLYGAGAASAICEVGFRIAEDHFCVWSPESGTCLARGPVITWASRSRARTISSLLFAALARHTNQVLPNARIAVHPGDTTVPALLKSIDSTIAKVGRYRTVSRYGDLLASPNGQ